MNALLREGFPSDDDDDADEEAAAATFVRFVVDLDDDFDGILYMDLSVLNTFYIERAQQVDMGWCL